MKLTGRPVGHRIRALLEFAQAQGAINYRDASHLEIPPENVSKCLSRAVGLGLMTTDRSQYPRTFSTIPDWQDRLDSNRTTRLAPPVKKRAKKMATPAVNSVWALAA